MTLRCDQQQGRTQSRPGSLQPQCLCCTQGWPQARLLWCANSAPAVASPQLVTVLLPCLCTHLKDVEECTGADELCVQHPGDEGTPLAAKGCLPNVLVALEEATADCALVIGHHTYSSRWEHLLGRVPGQPQIVAAAEL